MKKQTIKSAGQKPVIELVDLVKEYGNKTVLQELNMSINKGEFITLLGASGSGKTTALRLIAGFEYPTRGEIKFNGIDVKDLPANKRPTNTVFQDYALFPHLNVEGNIKYGLKLFRTPIANPENDLLKSQEIKTKWETIANTKIGKVDQQIEHKQKQLTNFYYQQIAHIEKSLSHLLKNQKEHALYISSLNTNKEGVAQQAKVKVFFVKNWTLLNSQIDKVRLSYLNKKLASYKSKSASGEAINKIKQQIDELLKAKNELATLSAKHLQEFEKQVQNRKIGEAKKLASMEARLEKLKKEWTKKANKEKSDLDQEQTKYTKILEVHKTNSRSYRKAQRWYDKLDFLYSYWESYVLQKVEAFNHKHTMRRLTTREVKHKVAKMVEMVGLQGAEKKTIDQLSGGMKQRVAIARSLILEPTVLLLDEPLSALDAKIRQKMQKDLRKLQRQLAITFIFVTHDQEEAMVMSDRVAVMRDGRIEQFASPKELYDYPVNAWVASFIGDSTQFKGRYVKRGLVEFIGQKFQCEAYDIPEDAKVDIMLRPEDFEITKGHPKNAYINGYITSRTFQGAMWEYRVHSMDNKIKLTVETNKTFESGQEVGITWDYMDVHVMPAEVKNGK